jgi:5-methylcytosine-specific restriction protein A
MRQAAARMVLKQLRPRIASAPDRLQSVNVESWRASTGGKTAARGYGSRWQSVRLGFLRSHPLCVICETSGRITAADTVDHVRPHLGDMRLFWDRSNWQPLCRSCHSSTKQRIEQAARAR